MGLKIVTDSATDLPESVRREYGLHVIPTPVVIEEKDYFDGETIFPEQFYDILRRGTDVRTYHINQQMFYDNFRPYAEAGDEVIYVCFSTGIAGTFNAANLAKRQLLEEFPNFDITIIDSKLASIGFGLIVIYALQMQRHGAPKEKILEALEWHRDHMNVFFTVETLEYLQKGGRLNKAAAIAGGILDLKPIIGVTKEGALLAREKVRGRARSLKRMVELVGEHGGDLDHQLIGLVHGDCYDTLCEFREELKETYGCRNFVENYVGCAIGAHTGPGILGVTFLDGPSPYQEYLE